MKTYTATAFGECYSIRADFSRASCQIERETADGWTATGLQVADFGHRPCRAMCNELALAVRSSGDAPEEYAGEINTAVDNMVENPSTKGRYDETYQ